MAVITFAGGNTLTTHKKTSAAELAKKLDRKGDKEFVGDFLTVRLEDGSTVLVNHRQVAYLTDPVKEDVPDDRKEEPVKKS